MQQTTKRNGAFIAAALALVGALLASGAIHRFGERGLRRLSDQLAGNARTLARSALDARLKVIEEQARAAASLQQIRGQIAQFDAATLKDGFRSEPWWAPFREDFSVYGVAVHGTALEAVEGMNAGDVDAAPLIAEARAHGVAAAYLNAGPKKWPYAAGAALIDVPGAQPAVIFLAAAVDQPFAQEMASHTNGAALLSDGQKALLSAGGEAEQKRLAGAPGHEQQGTYETDDPSWAAAATPLNASATLWTYASAGAQADEVRRDESTDSMGVWILGLLIAGGAVFIGTRKPAAVPKSADSGISGPANLLHSGDPTENDPEGSTAIQKAPPKPATAPAPQNVFGRYVLLDRLGEGGMAEVFTAVTYGAEGFRRTFVIKRLRPEMARNNDVVSAFIDEANLASSLVHTNIVPVFDFGKVNDEYYLAQEYILGRDLGRVNRRALEKEQKPLPLSQVFYVAHETLKALDYAHSRLGPDGKPLQLVHRDVSPNNILVSARGEVKLFDFGIAKAQGRITQTQFGTVKGNVRFMSPEQARGEAVDGRSDLFAIGLVIYYALAGDALYAGDTAYSLLIKAAQGPTEKERETLQKLPREAQRILERALQPNPDDRYQTAAEFAQALAPFIAGAHEALARTMDRLFAEDIRAEEARFAAAAQPAPAAPPSTEPAGAEDATGRYATPGRPNNG